VKWLVGTVAETFPETVNSVSLRLDVPGWPGHRAGQHVDVRLTAEDGYQAERSYSIASPPGSDQVELTVVRLDDGEVSPYLAGDLEIGDQIELRGPIGGYFVWDGDDSHPVLLAGGGSGVVPLMSMLRHHATIGSDAAMHLVYSARAAGDVLYREELDKLAGDPRRAATITLTREADDTAWTGRRGRVDASLLHDVGWPATTAPRCYVCGPDTFVEAVANELVGMGHQPENVRTERFGPTGG
jgi:ferredoxin-NADP reductase